MAREWTPTVPDGATMGAANGGTYRVFNPPWWAVRRWFGWWYACLVEWVARMLLHLEYGTAVELPAVAHGRVELLFRSPTGKLVGHSVRVISVPARPRFDVVANSIRRI